MLVKMVNLNIRQIRGEIISSSLFFILFFSSLFLLSDSLLYVGYTGPATVMMIKGYCNIFCDKAYRDDAAMYMTLPVSNEMIISSRVLACVMWTVFIQASVVIGVLVGMLFFDKDLIFVIERVVGEYQELRMTPLQIGIAIGLQPVSFIVFTVTICFFVMTVQSLFNRMGKNKRKSVAVMLGVIVSGGAIFGIDRFIKFCGQRELNYLLLQICFQIILVLLNATMYRFCKGDIERR